MRYRESLVYGFGCPALTSSWSKGLTCRNQRFRTADTALHIDVMKQELRFLEDLTQATSYEMANDSLTLLDGHGVAVAEFE